MHGHSTDAAILDGLPRGAAGDRRRRRLGGRRSARRCRTRASSRAAATGRRTRATPTSSSTRRRERDEVLVELGAGQTLVELPYPDSATARRRPRRPARPSSAASRCSSRRAPRRSSSGRACRAPVDVMRRGRRLARVTLALTTAGESHGPALVAIVTGLPAGLTLDRDGDRRRPAPPPAGLRPQPAAAARAGRGRGARRAPPRPHARDAARARRPQPRPRELGVGDEPVAARGRAAGQGHEAGHAAPPRPRRPRGRAQVRPRATSATRSSAPARGIPPSSSRPARVAKALLRELGIEVAGTVLEIGGEQDDHEAAIDAARADRDTLGGVVEVRATRRLPGPRLVRDAARSASTRGWRRRVMGIQAVKGVEIGDGFALARERGSAAHDEIEPGRLRRRSNRAGGIEAGVSNGEEIVVRAAMKPLPTLMRPLDSVDLATGEPARGARRAQRRGRGRGAGRRRRGGRRLGARASPRATSSAATRSAICSRRTPPTSSASSGPR